MLDYISPGTLYLVTSRIDLVGRPQTFSTTKGCLVSFYNDIRCRVWKLLVLTGPVLQ
jgi:hypothetical protein